MIANNFNEEFFLQIREQEAWKELRENIHLIEIECRGNEFKSLLELFNKPS